MNKRRYSNRRRKNILRVFILLMAIIITVVMWRTIKIDVQVGELVDLVIVMVFLAITYQTTILSLSDLVVNFLLPVNVSCCICFRVLYSRWEKSEYIAVLSCLVWVGLWMMIVANDVIYQKIVTPVWVAMLILTFVYFVFCVQKSLVFDEKILEDYTYEIRI